MKRYLLLGFLILSILPFIFIGGIDEENRCFNDSYTMITDSMLAVLDSVFNEMDVANEPFVHFLYCIHVFTHATSQTVTGCIPLDSILTHGTSNAKSNTLATCALMQRMGWDVLCFYNTDECYLGINLTDNWYIRTGNWVEKDGKMYYLKEFNLSTPVGSLLIKNPATTYKTISPKKVGLNPVPRLTSLPPFKGDVMVRKLSWDFTDSTYAVLALIPEEQVLWTQNLPPSLYGMAFSGMVELENMGLVEALVDIVSNMSEFDAVNCLYKLSQSESIFEYDNTQPIQSVSQQLINGRNDCDGRSVFLYVLLRTVMDYQPDDIVFLSWPNHIALGVAPRSAETFQRLFIRQAFSTGDYFVLDPAYSGNTEWGDKMARLSDTCEIIK